MRQFIKNRKTGNILIPLFFLVCTFASACLYASPALVNETNSRGNTEAVLNSGWYFIPGQFIDPLTNSIPENAIPVGMPVAVNSLLPGQSLRFGSFIGMIKIPWQKDVVIKSQQFSCAFTLYADGNKIFSAGTPSTSAVNERPLWNAEIYDLPIQRDRDNVVILVIHASGFGENYFGFSSPLIVGEKKTLQEGKVIKTAYDFFTVGILFVMGIYYLFAWISHRRQKSALAFSMLCLSLMSRPLLYGEFFILYLWPSIPFELLFRTGYLTMSFGMIWAPLFFYWRFPKSIPAPVTIASSAVGIIYTIMIIAVPIRIMSGFLPAVQLLLLAMCVATIFFVIRAAVKKETGAAIILSGFIAFFITVVLDVLSANAILSFPTLTPFGLIILVFVFSFAMTRSYAVAFDNAENLAHELKETNDSMRRFVPSEFLEHLGRDRFTDVTLGEHVVKEMTVMFTDIRSFTLHAEELGADGTFAFLNRWLGLMGPIIRGHGGFVDKYIGDGILSLFPEKNADAIGCAVAMLDKMKELNKDRIDSGFSPVHIGTGIHHGTLVLGTIGEPLRMETTVIADTVNIASRLESVTKEMGVPIIVSSALLEAERTYAHHIRYLGKVIVKGKKQAVEIHEIYDCDDDGDKKKKTGLLERFGEGLEYFNAREFEKALPVFQSIIEEMSGDLPSHYYARMSRKLQA